MNPSPLSALRADELGCILRVALAADGGTMQARCRLSLVCRKWRDSLRSAKPARAVGSVGDATQLSASSSLYNSGFGTNSFVYACGWLRSLAA